MNDEQQIIEPVPTMAGYKKIPTFKLWIANQFPYIETDFDAITNYELLQAVIKYLNTIIENENNVESNVTTLYNSFVNLHNYIENYFDNLDVQDEINNKLDAMAEDGTLADLINIEKYNQLDEKITNNYKKVFKNNFLTRKLSIHLDPSSAYTQGGIITKDYFIISNTDVNGVVTKLLVYDLNYNFIKTIDNINLEHCNSMCYNSKTKDIYAVGDNNIYIFNEDDIERDIDLPIRTIPNTITIASLTYDYDEDIFYGTTKNYRVSKLTYQMTEISHFDFSSNNPVQDICYYNKTLYVLQINLSSNKNNSYATGLITKLDLDGNVIETILIPTNYRIESEFLVYNHKIDCFMIGYLCPTSLAPACNVYYIFLDDKYVLDEDSLQYLNNFNNIENSDNQTFYVDYESQTNALSNGTQTKPFHTITDALRVINSFNFTGRIFLNVKGEATEASISLINNHYFLEINGDNNATLKKINVFNSRVLLKKIEVSEIAVQFNGYLELDTVTFSNTLNTNNLLFISHGEVHIDSACTFNDATNAIRCSFGSVYQNYAITLNNITNEYKLGDCSQVYKISTTFHPSEIDIGSKINGLYQLPNNFDLNDLKQEGKFSSITNHATLINAPDEIVGPYNVITVERLHNNYYLQRLYNVGTNKEYKRYWNNISWSSWNI